MQENDARFLFMFVLCQKGVKKARKLCRLQSQKNKKIKKGRSSVCPREEEDKEEDTKKKTQRRSFGLIFTTNQVNHTNHTFLIFILLG